MLKKFFRFGIFLLPLLLVGVIVFYFALTHVPESYTKLVRIERAKAKADSEVMLHRVSVLSSDIEVAGDWHAAFTADEINGCLAYELARKFPNVLPRELSDPRVEINEGSATFYMTASQSGVESVVQVTAQPTIQSPGVMKVRIVSAKAGAIPLPLSTLRKWIDEGLQGSKLKIEWLEGTGQPEALLSISANNHADMPVLLERISLSAKGVYVSGVTDPTWHEDGDTTENPTEATEDAKLGRPNGTDHRSE